jgi:CBS domain-containing protein
MNVSQIMQTEVVAVRPSDRLDFVDDLMALGHIRHVPVVDAEGRLVGLVTQSDVLRASVTSVLNWPPSKEYNWLGTISVHEVMTRELIAVGPDDDVTEALSTMVSGKLGCLPVVENGKLIGLVTETDCLVAFRKLLNDRATKRNPNDPKLTPFSQRENLHRPIRPRPI